MSKDNTIWHVFYHFYRFFVLFSCYIFTNHWLTLISKSSNSSNHFIYIYPCRQIMLHGTQDLVFYALKALLKSKSNTRDFSELFSLTFILRIVLLHLNDAYLFFNCILIRNTTTYLQLLTKLPKMKKIAIFLLFSLRNLLFRCGDIEANRGPKYLSLTFCHWNLSGLTTHNSNKISLLQAYITQHNYDLICLSETFPNSSIETNNDRISIDG